MLKIMNLEDIENLIQGKVEEDLTLEYKRQIHGNKGIAKEIAAFANAEGGIIIYGLDTKDRIPTSINWIEAKGFEEKIQNIAATAIDPKVESVTVLRIPNPDNAQLAIFIVEVPRSPEAPHMNDNRYYKRHGSTALPMDNNEVKLQMFGVGRNKALRFEISSNMRLLDESYSLIESLMAVPPERRQSTALIPFYTDAWQAVIASGSLFAFPEQVIQQLTEIYEVIHDINSLIDWLKYGGNPIVHTTAYRNSFKEHGTYIPSILQNKLGKLRNLLNLLSEQFEIN